MQLQIPLTWHRCTPRKMLHTALAMMLEKYSVPALSAGLGSRIPHRSKKCRCSNPQRYYYKMCKCRNINYVTHEYERWRQIYEIAVYSTVGGIFCKICRILPPTPKYIFDPRLVKIANIGLIDMAGPLYHFI